jgi:hypothetical protein
MGVGRQRQTDKFFWFVFICVLQVQPHPPSLFHTHLGQYPIDFRYPPTYITSHMHAHATEAPTRHVARRHVSSWVAPCPRRDCPRCPRPPHPLPAPAP